MTWIIGSPRVVGYSLLLSDVRVTLGDGSELDCLQKIYPVGRFLVVGFAGNIQVGFAMIEVLRQWLYHPDEHQAWIPEETAELLPGLAKDLFLEFPNQNREGGCELILAGIHPNERMGDAPWTRPSVFTFRAPDFTPEPAKINTFVSIGSGGYVDEYRKVLEAMSGLDENFMQIETMGGPFGHSGGSLLSRVLRNEMQARPSPGISRHFHICVVRLANITFSTNNENIYHANGEVTEFRMPPVASSWNGLVEMLSGNAVAIGKMVA